MVVVVAVVVADGVIAVGAVVLVVDAVVVWFCSWPW